MTSLAQPVSSSLDTAPSHTKPSHWRELWTKEDYWAIWIGLGIVILGAVLFANGSSLRWLSALPPRWTDPAQVLADLSANYLRYGAQFLFWAVSFSIAGKALGYPLRSFVPAFAILYLASLVIFIISQWDKAVYYNLEAPLIALLGGLILANVFTFPAWFRSTLRVEFFIKVGIVLLGATVPFSLIVFAGPVAIVQAAIVSIATFLVIYSVGVKLGLDRRLAATLGAGGAVCGVSAAIAVASAVGAKKDDAPIAITAVILWAIVMIFALPLIARGLGLPTGVAGAWIGTSEFADAAGIAAAQAYGGFAGKIPGIAGTSEQALQAFTLMKIVGRDVWIGIWAFVLAIIATKFWDDKSGKSSTGAGSGADRGEIWRRFPKFVLGFLVASLLVTAFTAQAKFGDYNKIAVPGLIAPIKDLRTWAFIFSFLSIGLTTRFKDLVAAGSKPLIAFTSGVVVNVVLGFLLSVVLFGGYWASLGQ